MVKNTNNYPPTYSVAETHGISIFKSYLRRKALRQTFHGLRQEGKGKI
jgi:hypothetical protein